MKTETGRAFPSRPWFHQPSLEAAFCQIDKISQVLPDVAISDCDFAYAPAELKRLGIRSILSLDQPSAWDLSLARDRRGLTVVEYLKDSTHALHPEIVEAGVEAVAVCLLDESEKNEPSDLRRAVNLLAALREAHPPVLVHCLAGKCRAPSVVATLMARETGCSFKDAVTQLSLERPIRLTPAFVYALVRANDVFLE